MRFGGENMSWRGAFIPLLLTAFLLVTGCRIPEGRGRVRVYLTSDGRDLEGVRSLVVELTSAGLHPAGMPVEESWETWLISRRVDLVPLAAGRTELISDVHVPAGRYDRVRVVVQSAQAWDIRGGKVPVRLTVEPIAAPFELKDGEMVEITIELIPLGTPREGFELFTKEAWVQKPEDEAEGR